MILVLCIIFNICSSAIAERVNNAYLSVDDIMKSWVHNYGNLKSMEVAYKENVDKAEKSPTSPIPQIVTNITVEKIECYPKYFIKISSL